MSSSFADFICAWNESMPIQIRDSDIKNPTEQIFRRLLIALLKTLYVDTSEYENMDSESGNLLRFSRVKLIATTNHFFGIANPDVKKRHDLVFMDLIQPSFKKVFNTLNYLMNYSVYVRHRYKETVLDLNEKLQEREELRTKKNQMRMAIEEAKIKEERNHKEIRELDTKIPRQKSQVAELEDQQKKLRNKIAKINEDSEKAEIELIEMKAELDDVKGSAMSDEEIKGIVEAKENVLKRLEEQNQFTAAIRQKLKENSEAIEGAQYITSKMEALLSAFNMNPQQIKTLKAQVDNVEANIIKMKTKIAANQAEITSTSQALAVKKNEIAFIASKLNEKRAAASTRETEQMKELKEAQNSLRRLTTQEAALVATNVRLRREQLQMFQIASNVIKLISMHMMDDEDTEN